VSRSAVKQTRVDRRSWQALAFRSLHSGLWGKEEEEEEVGEDFLVMVNGSFDV
jgi:hypothetical protein